MRALRGDPAPVSYWLARNLPLPAAARQRLLEAPTAAARLAAILDLLGGAVLCCAGCCTKVCTPSVMIAPGRRNSHAQPLARAMRLQRRTEAPHCPRTPALLLSPHAWLSAL